MIKIIFKKETLHTIIENVQDSLPCKKLLVGVPLGSVDRQGISNENKALWLEHGFTRDAGGITPARPFMAMSLEKMSKKDFVNDLLKNPASAGEKAVKIMQETMDRGRFIPLKESTLSARRRRGNTSVQPTVDSGQLKDSIDYEVIK